MRRLLLFCLLLLLLGGRYVLAAEDVYALNRLSTSELVKRGQEAVEKSDNEQALVYFTVAAKRYAPGLDKQEKFQTMVANMGKWYIYFFEYFDHVNAFQALSTAQEIAGDIGHNYSRIMLSYGCMYQTLAEQSDDKSLLGKAWGYYLKSFLIGLKNDSDMSSANMAFSNLVQLATELNRVDELKPLWKDFLRRNAGMRTSSPSFTFDSLFYGIILKLHSGDYAGAIAGLNSERMNRAVTVHSMRRYDIVRRINLAKAYIGMTGRYDEALECMLSAEAIADSVGMKDARLEVYKTLRDIYSQAGKKENALEYQHKYLELKDTVLNYRSGAAISELTYLKKVETVEHDLDEMDRKRAVQVRIIWGAAGLIVLAVVLLLLLRRHNRRLRQLNEVLYRNNSLLMEKEDATRRELEESVRRREQEAGADKQTSRAARYSGSDLSEADKDNIYLSVMDVLLHSPEVFTPEFSSSRLAELTGYTYRHISQVINEKTGDNFNALVNDIRVKAACRGMQPGGRFARLTVEAVANAVGFRSRTSFIAAFKKFTGMTPSAYMKTAENDSRG